MQSKAPVVLVAAALLAFAGAAAAADEPPKPTRFTADAGLVTTSGNTDVVTVTANDKLEHDAGKMKYKQEGGAVWGETGGIETAGKYFLGVQANYAFRPRLSTYALAGWKRNTFAGVKTQFDEGIGLAWNAVAPAPQKLDFEVGVGLTQREPTVGESDDFTNARFAGIYSYDFVSKARFEAFAAYLLNLDDTEDSDAEGRASLSAPFSQILSVKLGYYVSYRNQPLPGLEKTDTTFSASVQVTL